jgi:hypothetical protein
MLKAGNLDETRLDLFCVINTRTKEVVEKGFQDKQGAKKRRNELIVADGGEIGEGHLPKNGHYDYAVSVGTDHWKYGKQDV